MDFPILDTGHNNMVERGCDLCVYRKEVIASIFGPGIRNATHTYSVNARSMIALRDLLFKHGITNIILHKSRGQRPTIIEVISGEVSLKGLGEARRLIVRSLDGKGNPFATWEIPVTAGAASFNIGNEVTVWYQLEVVR